MYIWNIANSKGGLCDVEGIWGGWARNTGGAGVGGRVKCELLLGASRAVNSVNSDGWVQNTSNPKICCKNRTRTYLTRLGKTWTYKTVCGIGSARMNECKTFRRKKGTWSLKKKKIPSLLASIGCNSVKTWHKNWKNSKILKLRCFTKQYLKKWKKNILFSRYLSYVIYSMLATFCLQHWPF